MVDDRLVLFLPGVGADPAFWRPVGDLLPARWSKVYFGWPGLAHQPPAPGVVSFDDLTAMVEAQLGETQVDLIAQSMGGAIALQVALRHPQKVRRIVLTAASGGLDVQALGAEDWRPNYAREFPNAARWVLDARPDYSADLHSVSHPAMLIWGDADPISPLAVGERLRDLLPNARLHVVKGGDHALAHNRAAEIAPLIQRHLEA